ncbi:MAG TPA: hypothetical protein VE010_06620 [Thermoanaerobaculia bacterium]|nr:hypothetical protein [Thermoanaerobaculia bacterium]
MNDTFPPSTPPADKAKYRQFLIDHQLDPNLDTDDLRRAVEEKSEAERTQLRNHWEEFLAAMN